MTTGSRWEGAPPGGRQPQRRASIAGITNFNSGSGGFKRLPRVTPLAAQREVFLRFWKFSASSVETKNENP